MHSWGQTHTAVVTPVVLPSHLSHAGSFRRSEQFGSVPSLHTRWTTLGVERLVDLWTKRPSVHSIHTAHDGGPRPQRGRGPQVVASHGSAPCRRATRFSASAST